MITQKLLAILRDIWKRNIYFYSSSHIEIRIVDCRLYFIKKKNMKRWLLCCKAIRSSAGHLESIRRRSRCLHRSTLLYVCRWNVCVITYEKCRKWTAHERERKSQFSRPKSLTQKRTIWFDEQRQIAHKYFILRLPFSRNPTKIRPIANSLFSKYNVNDTELHFVVVAAAAAAAILFCSVPFQAIM